MKSVSLDYVSPKPLRRQAIGVTVLLLSLMFAGYLAHDYIGLSERLASLQAQLEHVRRGPADIVHAGQRSTPAITSALRAEVEENNRVIRQLGLPWNELFDAIESIPHEHVAILGIQPDAEGGSLTLSAEAKEVADITVYMDTIGELEILQDAHLINHQIKTQDPQKPISFSIGATWVGVGRVVRNAGVDGSIRAQ